MRISDTSAWYGFVICIITIFTFQSLSVLGRSPQVQRGFILTAPKAVDAGGLEYFTFTAFDVPQGGQVTLKLLHWYTEELLSETKFTVLNNINMWVEMSIPPTSADVKAKLKVEGVFSDGYRIDAEKQVLIRHNSVLTFVQTDKPIYKPGQTVRFRILPMDGQLKPLPENTVGDVWIEDPSGIRVAQWKEVKFPQGIVQLELPLSNEPPFGTWTIKSTVNQVSNTQKFKVEKYVLPKFDVKINPPAYLMADADFIPVEVCAWYSYGKEVDGMLKIKVTYKRYEWERRFIPSVEQAGLISGCETFRINTQDILLQRREFGFRTIEIFAEVVENGTEIMGNASATVEVTHEALKLKFLSALGVTDYFKPGIPFYGKLLVQKPDGVPAASEKVEICAQYHQQSHTMNTYMPNFRYPSSSDQSTERRCHMFTSNKKGIINFSVPPKPLVITKINLIAEAINYEPQQYMEDIGFYKLQRPHANLYLSPWFSPSHSYLQIQAVSGEMECEKLQRVKVRYTAEKGSSIKFYHQVLSRGRIVQQGSHQRTFYSKEEDAARYDLGDTSAAVWPNSEVNKTGPPDIGEFLLSFDPRATMSPIARLLVFYVRPDGEVVADSRVFRISHCLLNKVGLHFRHEQQYPSTEASLLLSASPLSICGINMIDKSVKFLSPEKQFKKENIFKVMESYDVGKSNYPHQVTEDYCMLKETKEETSTPGSFSPQPSQARFHHLSRSISLHADTSMAFEEAGMVVISNFELETRPCVQRPPVAIAYNYDFEADRPEPYIDRSSKFRFRSPAALSPKPKVEEPSKQKEEIRSYFPETWLWEIHTVGLNGELAFKRKLPHTITQWVGGAVCVHPKTGLGISEDSSITAFQPFFVSYQLPYSVIRGEVLPLIVSVFNYLSDCLPIKVSLEPSEQYEILSDSRSHIMCVCGGKKKTYRFVLKPLVLGHINITVHGFSLEDDNEVCGNEVTARLSAMDAISKQLLVEAEGFPKEELFNYFVCPENTNKSYETEVDLLLPEDVVDGSARAIVAVSGDLMGPALNGLKGLVRLPMGCGEQNMVLFTPNIFVMDYLIATKSITGEIKQECLNNMKTGYQRELQYRHKDGSYSAFGSRDLEGSLWLTAFVVRSFGQARRFVTIDEQDLWLSTSWILEKQFENGCFEQSGSVFNKAMKGGLSDTENSLAPLTAYVLISILESGVQRPDQPAVQNALKCLAAEVNPSSYALALFAYAHSLAKEPTVANRYLKYLEDRAVIKGYYMYWEPSIKDGESKSVSVEIAGYYILGKIEIEGKESTANILPVVRWIIQQRNSNGGFVSTQDTVVALQALAQYAALQSQTNLDMGIVVESDELVKGFKLEEANKLVTQTVNIPILPAVVDLQAVGDGCALIQFSLRYNVEKITGSEAFDLNIDAIRQGSSKCNLPRLGICMRFRIPDQKTNMVVVSVKMASGFVPDEWSLYQLQSDPKVQLKRHEVDGNQVNLYFNELTNEQKCFMFHIKSEMDIEDIKPSSIKLYDYYQPELEITKEYTIPSACSASALPEMPWLPPLIIDTDDDNGLDKLLINTFTESGEEAISTETNLPNISPSEVTPSVTWTEITIMSELSAHTDVLGESTLSGSENSEKSTNINEVEPFENKTTSILNTETVSVGEEIYSAIPMTPYDETTPYDEITTYDHGTESYSTTLGIANETSAETEYQFFNVSHSINEANAEEIQMASDANFFQSNKNISHLDNFINVEDELDFPEGIEGNVPVSVKPQMLIPSQTRITATGKVTMECPVCRDNFPENFTEIYCSSAFALRVIVKESAAGSVKILQDISSFLPQPNIIKKMAKLEYNSECYCPQLRANGFVVIIVGTPIDLWIDESEKHRIQLTNSVHVISSTKTMLPVELKKARNICSGDP